MVAPCDYRLFPCEFRPLMSGVVYGELDAPRRTLIVSGRAGQADLQSTIGFLKVMLFWSGVIVQENSLISRCPFTMLSETKPRCLVNTVLKLPVGFLEVPEYTATTAGIQKFIECLWRSAWVRQPGRTLFHMRNPPSIFYTYHFPEESDIH